MAATAANDDPLLLGQRSLVALLESKGTGVGSGLGEGEDQVEEAGGRVGGGERSSGLDLFDAGDLVLQRFADHLRYRPVAWFELVPGGEPDHRGVLGVVVDQGARVRGRSSGAKGTASTSSVARVPKTVSNSWLLLPKNR
jgi:hypothetical protein